jgi:hypothetical protein
MRCGLLLLYSRVVVAGIADKICKSWITPVAHSLRKKDMRMHTSAGGRELDGDLANWAPSRGLAEREARKPENPIFTSKYRAHEYAFFSSFFYLPPPPPDR